MAIDRLLAHYEQRFREILVLPHRQTCHIYKSVEKLYSTARLHLHLHLPEECSMTQESTFKIAFHFSPQKRAELDALTRRCGHQTAKDLMNHALTIIDWVSRKQADGYVVRAVHPTSGHAIE